MVGVIMQGYDSGVRVVTASTLCVYSEGRESKQNDMTFVHGVV